MKTTHGMGAVVGLALIAMVSTTGRAAERPGQDMADVTVRLMQASTHAEVLVDALDRAAPLTFPASADGERYGADGHDLAGWPKGQVAKSSLVVASRTAPAITPEMGNALDGLEAAVLEARRTAAGNPWLEPGIGHVLANTATIRSGNDPSADPDSLAHEIAIELRSLANNARVLEAEADLRAAVSARRFNRTDAFRGHLEAAVQVMGQARTEGAYHLEDDIATLQTVLARVREGASARDAVNRDAVDELIADIHEHLSDLGGE
jgi:hypothetical protein